MPTAGLERLANVLVLNVRMEGIEQDPDPRMAHSVTQSDGIRSRIEEVSLEAIERFHRQRHVVLVESRAKGLKSLHGKLPLVLRPPRAGQVADRGAERTGKDGRADLGCRPYPAQEILSRGTPDLGILGD